MCRMGRCVLGVVALLFAGLFMLNCGSGSTAASLPGNSTATTANATITLSDPATCAGTAGRFAHVYVTVTDVRVHTSDSAGPTDSGWQDLTPGLAAAPKQIDLLGQANNQCFLATLGATTQLQPGTYQQIRLILADNTATISNNACAAAGAVNCVVLNSTSTPKPLLLSSESKTGIKIPSGQISSGKFTIAAGETKDLNLDFDTCASIVQEGNGQYRLKPVLHAGEVSTTSTSINGKVIDQSTGAAVTGSVLVALEQKDATGVDRIVMTTLTNADGTFVFCPIPAGAYDVVVVGVNNSGVAYAPSILTGISNGQTTGTLALYAPPAGALSTSTMNGSVTSQSASSKGIVIDVQLSALTTLASGTYTIPLVPNAQQSSATLALETLAVSTCPLNTDCVSYSVLLPARGAYVAAYSTTTPSLTQSSAFATYTLDGFATAQSSGGIADCMSPELKTSAYALTASSVSVAVTSPLSFTQCQ